MTEPNPFDELFGGMMRDKAGIPNPKIGYHCTKCKYELTTVNKGNSFDFQKMFYCNNKSCERFGCVVVIAIKHPKH